MENCSTFLLQKLSKCNGWISSQILVDIFKYASERMSAFIARNSGSKEFQCFINLLGFLMS